jgi:aspartate aminotransferase-like enzyme
MNSYENGAHSYHSTMPTDSLVSFRNTLLETEKHGFEKIKKDQINLGKGIRNLLESKGFKSVASNGFQSTSVVVSYTDNPEIKSGKAFIEQGIQIAAGIPLECDEGGDFLSFRIGLFGLDKLLNPKRTIDKLDKALSNLT